MTGARAALANWLRAMARLRTVRSAPTHIPRPGSRPARSATSAASGPTTKRISDSAGREMRVAMQRRVRTAPSASTSTSSPGAWVNPLPMIGSSLGFGELLVGRLGLRRLDPAQPDARVHDDRPGVVAVQSGVGNELDELVGSEVGQILKALDALATELDDGGELQTVVAQQVLGDPEFGRLGAQILFDLVEICLGPFLDRLATPLVEACHPRQLLGLSEGHVLDRGEALGNQKLGDHLLDVQRVHEHFGQLAELTLAPLAVVGVGDDVNVPAGQLRR